MPEAALVLPLEATSALRPASKKNGALGEMDALFGELTAQ